jgi:hypothetical protein
MIPIRFFTNTERQRLLSADPLLEELCVEVNKKFPIFIVCGKRDKDAQELAFAHGLTKVHYPNSKHNTEPYSKAIDICPYPIDWNNRKAFYEMYKVVMETAQELGIKIRAGADFNQDGDLTNDKFVDLPHFELAD